MKEMWKDVDGYEGRYQISNLGNVKSIIHNKERIKKRTIDSRGYYIVSLAKQGKSRSYLVHRLVAQAFIPNPQHLPVVNHIDGNKKNPCADNLEWCSYQENHDHALRTGLIDLEYNQRKLKEGMDIRRQWLKEHKVLQVALSKETDADCIAMLETKADYNSYIIGLIRADLARFSSDGDKSIDVVGSAPAANKKGLRIEVEYVVLNKDNILKSLHIDYSGLHARGGGVVEVSGRNKIWLPEE